MRLLLFLIFIHTTIFCKAQIINRYDVVITEIMADPTPQLGLPNAEFIELKNNTTQPINLSGARLADATSTSGPMPNFILQPNSYVIVCTSSAVAGLTPFGTVISVTSFPSLDNASDIITLRNAQTKVIHSVAYTDAWYQNPLKKDGGWTLEMVDSNNPCNGSNNWRASTDLSGGTPGRVNSVQSPNPDAQAPSIDRAFATDPTTFVVVFTETIDSTTASLLTNYTIDNGINLTTATPQAPMFDRVVLKTTTPLIANTVYNITINQVRDCAGNTITANSKTRAGLSTLANPADVVINEILFNPQTNGNDYIELYNNSNKIIDCKQLFIANRNSTNAIDNIKACSAENYLLFPADYVVVTESKALVLNNYIAQNPKAFLEIPTLPSYNTDKGNVLLLNAQGIVIDDVAYTDKWHFDLLTDVKGIALERIQFNQPTQDKNNWHSAAKSVGYGTPTFKNSQQGVTTIAGNITLSNQRISPNNDGFEDFVQINYNFANPGNVANITIFDAAGRTVKYLQRNALCGTSGAFKWDGLNEKMQQLNTGVYIILTNIFNTQGQKAQYKNTIVVTKQ
jgi:hypothetical protein